MVHRVVRRCRRVDARTNPAGRDSAASDRRCANASYAWVWGVVLLEVASARPLAVGEFDHAEIPGHRWIVRAVAASTSVRTHRLLRVSTPGSASTSEATRVRFAYCARRCP